MRSQRKFNAVVLGAGGVGKSALTIRFHRNVFIEQYNPTIEEQGEPVLTFSVKLELLDTPGTEQFTALNERYLRASLVPFIFSRTGEGFYSLIEESSLREIDSIRQQIYQIKGTDRDIPIVIVGTKLDLNNEREVSRAKIQELARQWNLPFYETSAKRNWHVEDVFQDLVRQMRKRYPDDHSSSRRKKDPCLVM
ncbi:predicted protein [Postia placenta Mad-698-R]|uniref:Uncharacterized protein n=1 Tax=Postia placenta MAD-698-R-SB12 TaxID=670580 RepID=A0A1X6MRZ9_9APHY|nr:hypothetical protein POSPLADRAFT_1036088 [Postia placenta MAD-698-R-SB12]EED81620.1 predicted protein [Postia placenta Mad-698-R]OSX59069.1 hypothetical protein POSPLADRAFT_1036088 [Postia placenta MAD-698-R-SB12]